MDLSELIVIEGTPFVRQIICLTNGVLFTVYRF